MGNTGAATLAGGATDPVLPPTGENIVTGDNACGSPVATPLIFTG